MKAAHRTTLAAFVAVLVLGALGAASASAALPALFTNLGEEVKSAFTFTGSGKQSELLTVNSGKRISCERSAITGEFINAKEVRKVLVTYSNCKAGHWGRCQSGSVGGVVQSEVLQGTLGYINKAKHEVGLRLEAEAKIGKQTGPWATKIKCEELIGIRIALRGSLIGVIGPVNELTEHPTVTHAGTSSGEQKVSKFEGSVLEEVLSEEPEEGFGKLTPTEIQDVLTLTWPHSYEVHA